MRLISNKTLKGYCEPVDRLSESVQYGRDGPENGDNFKLGTLAYGEENSLNCRTIQ